jgi:hypothetical protein
MTSGRRILLVYGALAAAAIVQAAYFYPRLPETVASHFDMDGRPNGTASRETFVVVSVATVIGMAVLLGGIHATTRLLVTRVPDKWLNLPNKPYWLAPERRAETLAYVIAAGSRIMWGVGPATLLFMLVTFQLAYLANVEGGDAMRHMRWLLAVFLAFVLSFVVVWTVRFYRRFRLPPEKVL